MKAFMKTKTGAVLFGFSVLAVWMLLAAGSALAHEKGGASLPSPSCSTILMIQLLGLPMLFLEVIRKKQLHPPPPPTAIS